MDGKSSHKVKLNATQCAPQASLNKQPASGVSPSAPATACNALGPANNDVANARAHEMEIMRAHRLLHARKAGLTSVGCSSRARELARLSTNWIASELHLPPIFQDHDNEAAPIATQQLSAVCLLVCRGSFANTRAAPGLGSLLPVR